VWLTSLAGGGFKGWFYFWVIFFWTKEILDNLLLWGLYLIHDTYNTMVCLGFSLGLIPSLCNRLLGGYALLWCRMSYFCFLVVEDRNVFLVFQGYASIKVNVVVLLGCIVKAHCAFPASIVLGRS
jgi:hypothetical protein